MLSVWHTFDIINDPFSVAMEDLSDGEQLKDSHEFGRVDMEVAANLGHLLAAMHQLTSKARISPKRWQELSFFR